MKDDLTEKSITSKSETQINPDGRGQLLNKELKDVNSTDHSSGGGFKDSQAVNSFDMRVFSEKETTLIYELARLFLENGELHKAELVLKGLVAMDPHFAPGWLGLAYLHHYASQPEQGAFAARKVLQIESGSVEGSLFLIVFLLNLGEISAAGAILGEIREKIESGIVTDQNCIRIYRSQLERFNSR